VTVPEPLWYGRAGPDMQPSRKPLLALGLLGLLGLPAVAVPALAQTSSGYPAACEASKVSKGDVERAHTVFLSGKGFLDESNYDKAISYFKDAYSIDCSVHAILPIIATAYERKGDRASAVQALQEYQKRVPAAPDHDVIDRRIKNLQDQSTGLNSQIAFYANIVAQEQKMLLGQFANLEQVMGTLKNQSSALAGELAQIAANHP